MLERWKRNVLESEDGVGTIEIVLILVVLIALVVIFREQLMAMIESIFSNLNDSVNSLY